MGYKTWKEPGSYSWTVPEGVHEVFIRCWGAGGNSSHGDYVEGILSVEPGDTLYHYVGGSANGQDGGFNGGGDGGHASQDGYTDGGLPYPSATAGGGGGATDLRHNSDMESARVIVAGGGGGDGAADGDHDEATSGGADGNESANDSGKPDGQAGTNASGGSVGGTSGPNGGGGSSEKDTRHDRGYNSAAAGGGGGGGYNGGGGGGAEAWNGDAAGAGGGGGSSYTGGVTGYSGAGKHNGTENSDGELHIGWLQNPEPLTVSSLNNGGVRLNWNDPNPNHNRYEVYRSTSPGVSASDTRIATLGRNETEYHDTDVQQNTEYFYRVRGAIESPNSDQNTYTSPMTNEASFYIRPVMWGDGDGFTQGIPKFHDGSGFVEASSVNWHDGNGWQG